MPTHNWIQHVKAVYAKGNISYKQALKEASKTWKKKKASPASPSEDEVSQPPKKKRRRKRATPKLPAKAAEGKMYKRFERN